VKRSRKNPKISKRQGLRAVRLGKVSSWLHTFDEGGGNRAGV